MKTAMRRIQTIHFIGIGGVGMSGIAEVLLTLGYRIQGSDVHASQGTRRLENLGAKTFIGHQAKHIAGADVVVVSSAIPKTNPELEQAHADRIPVVPRAQMLAELMRFRHGIAVAGTHGKTTTTSLVASILAEGNLDPTYVIGGRLLGADRHAGLGEGKYLVAEADESDNSFLHLQPMIAIVTNIDNDHLGTYAGDPAQLRKAFVEFLHNLPFYGLAIMCIDDAGVLQIIEKVKRSVTTYGLSEQADIRAENLLATERNTQFTVRRHDNRSLDITLNLPGEHNVKNALAAIAVAFELGIRDHAIQVALEKFQGIARRLEHVGRINTAQGPIDLVDDYAHHPTEIAAAVDALRKSYPGRRLLAVFQPHRFTRTRDLLDDFANSLCEVDVLIITEVYAAGEARIAKADGRALARAVRSRSRVEPIFVGAIDKVPATLSRIIKSDDVIVTLGAGSVGQLPQAIKEQLSVSIRSGVRHGDV